MRGEGEEEGEEEGEKELGLRVGVTGWGWDMGSGFGVTIWA